MTMTLPQAARTPLRALWRWIFKPAARYPADPRAIFILALSIFGGLAAIALDAAPQTLNAILPHWGVLSWGIFLTAGSALTLIGMAYQNLNGVIVEQVGSVIVGAATLFYSVLAFYVAGLGTLQPVGIILAWGMASFVRWGQLQALIVTSYKKAVEEGIIHDG